MPTAKIIGIIAVKIMNTIIGFLIFSSYFNPF